MTKVVHLTSVHSAGDARIFHKECKTLAEAGYEVILIVPHDRDEVLDGVRIRALPRPANRLRRLASTVWQAYRAALGENAQIYHFHDPELMPVGLLLKARGKRVIYDIHEENPDFILIKEWIPRPLRPPLYSLVGWFEGRAASNFDALVVASDSLAERFRPMARKLEVIHNFPAEDMVAAGRKVGRGDSAEPDRPRLLYVGSISAARGAWTMVEALPEVLAKHPEAKLILVGAPVTRELAEVLRRFLADQGMEGSMELVGQVKLPEVASYLASSTIGLVPFRAEAKYLKNVATKLFDYMAFGLPVVASDLPPARLFMADLDCGLLVEPEDPHAHAEAINYLLEHPAEAAAMGRRGREAVVERYNWARMEKRLLALYARLIL